MTAPIRSMPEMIMVADNGEVLAVVRRHQDIADVFRLMKERLGLTNEFCDDAGGLTKGHTDKILGPSESKSWGPTTFDLFCEMFAIEFRVHIDLEAAKRMQAVWEGRERPLYPDSKTKRISKKLIERAKPFVIRDLASMGGTARHALLTGKQRIKIARKAARKSSRNKKLPVERRSEICKNAAHARWMKRELIVVASDPAGLDAAGSGSAPACALLVDQSQPSGTIAAPVAATQGRSAQPR